MNGPYNTPDTLIVSLDIGKNVHCLGCYDGQLTELVARMDRKMSGGLTDDTGKIAEAYKSLMSQGLLFSRMFPHDRPVIQGGPPW